MGKSTEIAIVLRLRDEMGGTAAKALDTLTRAAKGVGQAVRQVGIPAADTDKRMGGLGQTARQAAQDVRSVGQEAANTAKPVDTLGRNAGKTSRAMGDVGKAAAKAGKSVGTMAYEALHGSDRATRAAFRLRDALRAAGAAGKAAARNIGQFGAAAGASLVGAARFLRAPVDYGKKINEMANTAFDTQGGERVKLGKAELRKTIENAARRGGDKGELAQAMQDMLASGMGYKKAAVMLPEVAYASSAAFAAPNDFANAAITAEKQGFIKAQQAGKLFAMMFKGGQLGQFEVKDMARFMPEILSQAQGMQNLEGVASLIAAAQVSRGGAATGGEAATNLTNLLKKLTSQDSQRHFKKIHGVDLNANMVAARMKGTNPLDAFVQLMDTEVFGKDKNVLKAQQYLRTAKGTDKEDDAKQAVALARKGALSKVIVDIEAQRAALAMVDRWDEYKGLKKEVLAADSSSMQVAHGSNEGELWYKWEQVTNRWNTAMDSITERMKGGLGALADAVVKAADKFPPLAETVVVATAAMSTLGLGFLASAGWKMLFGGGSGGSGGSGEAAAAGAESGGLLGMFGGKGGFLATAGLAAWDIYATESNDALTRAQKNVRHSENAGGLAGAIAGAKMGAALGAAGGSIVPGLGTAAGGVLGGLAGGAAGWWSGSNIGRWAGEKLWGPSTQARADAQKVVVEDKSTLHVESVLHLDGREVARAVNDYNTADAKRE